MILGQQRGDNRLHSRLFWRILLLLCPFIGPLSNELTLYDFPPITRFLNEDRWTWLWNLCWPAPVSSFQLLSSVKNIPAKSWNRATTLNQNLGDYCGTFGCLTGSTSLRIGQKRCDRWDTMIGNTSRYEYSRTPPKHEAYTFIVWFQKFVITSTSLFWFKGRNTWTVRRTDQLFTLHVRWEQVSAKPLYTHHTSQALR